MGERGVCIGGQVYTHAVILLLCVYIHLYNIYYIGTGARGGGGNDTTRALLFHRRRPPRKVGHRFSSSNTHAHAHTHTYVRIHKKCDRTSPLCLDELCVCVCVRACVCKLLEEKGKSVENNPPKKGKIEKDVTTVGGEELRRCVR